MSEGNPTATAGGEGWQLARAPEFVLPGADGRAPSVHRLGDYTDEGCVLLGFYPRSRLGDSAFLDWFEFTDRIDALVISNVHIRGGDGPLSDGGLSVPVLGDANGSVADDYGTDYDESPGTIVLVDSNELIRATWRDEFDATEIYSTARQHMRKTHTDHGEGDR